MFLVGAPNEDDDAAGGAALSQAGFAYFFKQTAGVWAQQQKVVPADRATLDFFANSVSIDGDYAILGAANEDENVHWNRYFSSGGLCLYF